MFASCAISSHDLCRSSSNRVLTTTDVSSVAITGCPLLGSSWMLTQPSQKWDTHRDTVLRSTTLSLQTSSKALWISVGFFPRKVSILMYDHWSLSKIWLQSVSSSISWLCFAEQGRDHVACQYAHSILYWSLAHSCRKNQNKCIILLAAQTQCALLLKWPGLSTKQQSICILCCLVESPGLKCCYCIVEYLFRMCGNTEWRFTLVVSSVFHLWIK